MGRLAASEVEIATTGTVTNKCYVIERHMCGQITGTRYEKRRKTAMWTRHVCPGCVLTAPVPAIYCLQHQELSYVMVSAYYLHQFFAPCHLSIF